ncbi:hypothetical protein BH09ACT8_BH09ACT8_64630 [soil metagenome]
MLHHLSATARTNDVVGRLMAAMADGDMGAVLALLHPDVTFTGDSNRRAPTAAQVIHGPDKVARFLFGLADRYGPAFFSSNQLALINGELGAYTPGTAPGGEGYPVMLPHIVAMTVRAGRVCAVWDIADPDKFTASPLRDQPLRDQPLRDQPLRDQPLAPDRPTESGTHPRS